MVRAPRVVERLRLRAGSESAVRHSLPALEDAFHTASLPDAGARLVCVRRLHLGQILSSTSPQGVALQIEERFAAADWRVVHAGDASGHDAQAVWFRDAFEAHELAAARLAAGRPLDAWFWPLALPGVMAQPSEQRFRATAFDIAAREEAPAALPAWTATLVHAGYREHLIAALRPGDGRALLRAAGVRHVASERARPAVATFTQSPGILGTEGPLDDRVVFVEAMTGHSSERTAYQRPTEHSARRPAATIERVDTHSKNETRVAAPLAAVDDDIDVRRRSRLETTAGRARETAQPVPPPKEFEPSLVASPDRNGEPPTGNPVPQTHKAQPADSARSSADGAREQTEQHISPLNVLGNARQDRDTGGQDRPSTGIREVLLSPWHIPYAAPTSAGGLLFLLAILEHIGFAQWAAERTPEQPELEVLAAEVLHLLLSRLSVADEDPVWQLVAPSRLKPEATGYPNEQRGFHLQAERREAGSAEDLRTGGFRLQAEGCEVAKTWLNACRRFLRRRVRIGLANLVVRPAHLAMTPTHVDVFFKLSAADLRIRRAGLDIDPGWVPWFKRVVTFHYGERPWK